MRGFVLKLRSGAIRRLIGNREGVVSISPRPSPFSFDLLKNETGFRRRLVLSARFSFCSAKNFDQACPIHFFAFNAVTHMNKKTAEVCWRRSQFCEGRLNSLFTLLQPGLGIR